MMGDRILFLMLGCLIGFVLGYMVRYLREIKTDVHAVDTLLQEVVENVTPRKTKEEAGFIRLPLLKDLALLSVVLLTVWAAFASQRISNDVQNTQTQLSYISACNRQFLAKTIVALNERTTFTTSQATANVELQKNQAAFFTLILAEPPNTQEVRTAGAKAYLDALTKFVVVSGKTAQKVEDNPYPTPAELSKCLSLNPREDR